MPGPVNSLAAPSAIGSLQFGPLKILTVSALLDPSVPLTRGWSLSAGEAGEVPVIVGAPGGEPVTNDTSSTSMRSQSWVDSWGLWQTTSNSSNCETRLDPEDVKENRPNSVGISVFE